MTKANAKKSTSNQQPSTFLKWVGGKRQLLAEIQRRAPEYYGDYYEPFLGGGSILFSFLPNNPTINDINPHLINTYLQIKNNPKKLIDIISRIEDGYLERKKHPDKYKDEVLKKYPERTPEAQYYYDIRDMYNKKIESRNRDEECAALMIWLNKHCYNGVYRVNSKGLFNVPYNKKESGIITVVNPKNIYKVSDYLNKSNAKILNCDFEDACANVKQGDFVYFDSPYIPVSKTANFVNYAKDGFTDKDHERLAKLFRELDKKGAKLMLSNNNVEDRIEELYGDFNISKVHALRCINRNAKDRKSDKEEYREVIITNY